MRGELRTQHEACVALRAVWSQPVRAGASATGRTRSCHVFEGHAVAACAARQASLAVGEQELRQGGLGARGVLGAARAHLKGLGCVVTLHGVTRLLVPIGWLVGTHFIIKILNYRAPEAFIATHSTQNGPF